MVLSVKGGKIVGRDKGIMGEALIEKTKRAGYPSLIEPTHNGYMMKLQERGYSNMKA